MSEPTDDEIRVAIAEFCGVKCGQCNGKGSYMRYGPHEWVRVSHYKSEKQKAVICDHMTRDFHAAPFAQLYPDYLNDLNAIHEAEKMLDVDIDLPESPRYAYSLEVYNICVDEQPFRATARQRALALYRVIKQ